MNRPQGEPQTEKPSFFKAAVVILLILTVCGFPFMIAFMKIGGLTKTESVQTSLPLIAQVPEFELLNQRSEKVTRTNFEKKVWVADFIFSRCGGTCPQMTAKMKKLRQTYPDLPLVSFTVDPTYDTPEIWSRYITRFEIDDRDWDFLSGSKEAMLKISQAFKVSGAEEAVSHSTRFVLIDAHGLIRGYYDPLDEESFAKLVSDLRSF